MVDGISGRGIAPKRLGVAIALFASLALAGCGNSDGQAAGDGSGPGKIAVYTTGSAATLPIWVAQQEGFFKNNHLDVSAVKITDSTSAIAGLGKQYQITEGYPPQIFKASLSRIDLAVVAGNEIETKAKSDIRIVASPQSGIKKPQDLAGKTLGAPTINGNIYYGALYFLQKSGVDVKTVQGRQVAGGNYADALKAGRVDAVVAQEPYLTNLLRSGFVDVGYPYAAIADPCPFMYWVAAGPWGRAHKDQVHQFQLALNSANAWIRAHPDEARQIVAKQTGLTADVANTVILADYSASVSPADLRVWEEPMASLGALPRGTKFDYDTLVVGTSQLPNE